MIISAADCIVLGGTFSLLSNDKECAWAEKHVRVDPDIGWVLGNFVEADCANSNGHIFPLEDLKASYQTIISKSLNVLHQGRYVVGSYVGAELIPAEDEAAADSTGTAIVEALAAFWRAQFPEEYELLKRAHSEGAAFYSMECIPEQLGCVAEGCELVADYQGRDHESYCDHIRGSGQKRLIKPHFSAGALIIPPVKPGWKRADISSLASKQGAEVMEQVYASLANESPHLDAKTWEYMMWALLEQV